MSKFMVTGATGALGQQIIQHLIQHQPASQVVALVRDPQKAASLAQAGVELRQGDYDQADTLRKAFQGINKLYFVSGSDLERRSEQHQKVVQAAKDAGVRQVAYSSFQRRREGADSPIALLAESHLKTEAWLKESGMIYHLLQHNLYMDVLPLFIGENLPETGQFALPAGDGKTAFALRADLAEAGAAVLLGQGHENQTYTLSGPEAISFAQLAKTAAEVLGKPITYHNPSNQAYRDQLAQYGVPAPAIEMAAGFAEAVRQEEFSQTSGDLEQLLGRKPATLKDYFGQLWAP